MMNLLDATNHAIGLIERACKQNREETKSDDVLLIPDNRPFQLSRTRMQRAAEDLYQSMIGQLPGVDESMVRAAANNIACIIGELGVIDE